jgi:hypothetical protein
MDNYSVPTHVINSLLSIAVGDADTNQGELRVVREEFSLECVAMLDRALSRGSTALKTVRFTQATRAGTYVWFEPLLRVLADYGHLRVLGIDGSGFVGDSEETCARILHRLSSTNNNTLKTIDVRRISLSACNAFSGFVQTPWTALRALILTDCWLDDECAAAIAEHAAAAAPLLKRLHLDCGCDAGSQSIAALCTTLVGSFQALRRLTVTYAECCDECALAVGGAFLERRAPLQAELRWMRYADHRSAAVLRLQSALRWHHIDLREIASVGHEQQPARQRAVIDLCFANERTREFFESRRTVPLDAGQQLDSGGDLAALPNEMLCKVLAHVYPARTVIELAHSCRLLRDCANNYVAWMRTGASDYRLLYRNVLLEAQRRGCEDPYEIYFDELQ